MPTSLSSCRTSEIWQRADKVVDSKTVETVSSARTRIERGFDPEAVRHMKTEARRAFTVCGPNLAAHAFKAGLVDECHRFIAPMVVGGGNLSLPDNVRLRLELLDERRFRTAWSISTTALNRNTVARPRGFEHDPPKPTQRNPRLSARNPSDCNVGSVSIATMETVSACDNV